MDGWGGWNGGANPRDGWLAAGAGPRGGGRLGRASGGAGRGRRKRERGGEAAGRRRVAGGGQRRASLRGGGSPARLWRRHGADWQKLRAEPEKGVLHT